MTIVLVTGTGTEVGKTWVTVALIAELRARGVTVAARKPAQSFAPAELGRTDAELLGAASGEAPHAVCPEHRWYPVAMAPPMAADALHRPRITTAQLARETHSGGAEIVLVEGAGGPRSPLAHDGDTIDLARALRAARVVLVADAGLGTINAVRLSTEALAGFETAVLLNRFEPDTDLHRRNQHWLRTAGFDVHVEIPSLARRLIDRVP